jgi:hypothetical protein
MRRESAIPLSFTRAACRHLPLPRVSPLTHLVVHLNHLHAHAPAVPEGLQRLQAREDRLHRAGHDAAALALQPAEYRVRLAAAYNGKGEGAMLACGGSAARGVEWPEQKADMDEHPSKSRRASASALGDWPMVPQLQRRLALSTPD